MIHGGGVWETENPAEWLDFSANLRPEGPPEWVMDVLRASLEDTRYYPDSEMRQARRGLAAYTGLKEECVLPTAGGTAAIDLALSARGGRVFIPEPEFGEYARRAAVHGRVCTRWKGECGAGDTLILSNPNNPTGSVRSREELLALHEKLQPAGAELIVDEAFIDYCPENSLRKEVLPRLAVIGSLTKILGIPGVRLGFICADPEVIHDLEGRALPWTLSAQAVRIATELPKHTEEIRRDAAINAKRREAFATRIRELGAEATLSGSNFLLADFRRDMAEIAALLKERKILVRTCESFGLPGSYLRLAVRTEAENEQLIHALEELLHAR